MVVKQYPIYVCTACAEADETSTEKEFVVVNTEEVPHAESEEVQSSLPPEIPVEEPVAASHEQVYQHTPQQQNVMTQHGAAVAAADPSKTFEEIVENVQGTFKFIQDSEIDVDCKCHCFIYMHSLLFVDGLSCISRLHLYMYKYNCHHGKTWICVICILSCGFNAST